MDAKRLIAVVLAALLLGLAYLFLLAPGVPPASPAPHDNTSSRSAPTPGDGSGRPAPASEALARADLPREAADTLRRIHRGGPYPYRQDGGTFFNRERLLPQRARGWYREYTVDTPGSRDRGPRRIVAGGDPPSEFFYTHDHYRSFRRIDAAAEALR